jgi:hypothetical protein
LAQALGAVKVGTSHELQDKGEAQGVGALGLGGVSDSLVRRAFAPLGLCKVYPLNLSDQEREYAEANGKNRGECARISKLIVGLIGMFKWLEKTLFYGKGKLLANLLHPRS